jgi:hypothetical protein
LQALSAFVRRIRAERAARIGLLAIGASLAFGGTGCSFVSSTLPPSAPDQRTVNAAKTCGRISYPLLDTLSAVAGYSFVVYADRAEEESSTKTYNIDWNTGMKTLVSQGPPTADYTAVRTFGYITMAAFGVSSLYGYYAAIRCANWRYEIAARKSTPAADAVASQAQPPKNFGGYTFDMTQAQAEQTCTVSRQAWQLEGAIAVCSPNIESGTAQPVRLEFQSGGLRSVTIVRHVPGEQLEKGYDYLYTVMRVMYGPPQVERAALVGACSGALAECMKQGETPKGPVWSWPTLTIELQPVWQGDQTVLEERYTRRDAGP